MDRPENHIKFKQISFVFAKFRKFKIIYIQNSVKISGPQLISVLLIYVFQVYFVMSSVLVSLILHDEFTIGKLPHYYSKGNNF